MPPRTRKETPEAVLMVEPESSILDPDPYRILPGNFVHVVTSSGAKYKSAEVLSTFGHGLTLRTSLLGPTQSEVTFVPWSAIDGVGLIGAR